MGQKEIERLLHEEGRGEVRCVFCNRVYLLERGALESLLREIE
ncbi:MAG: Hsp33 family molecular chaperone HslO [Candidatus Caldatribacteriaceae bacterium]